RQNRQMLSVNLGESTLDEDARLARIRQGNIDDAGTQGRDDGRMSRQHGKVALKTRHNHLVGVLRHRHPLGCHQLELECTRHCLPAPLPHTDQVLALASTSSGVCSLAPQNGQKNTGWSTMLGSSSFSGSTMPIDM